MHELRNILTWEFASVKWTNPRPIGERHPPDAGPMGFGMFSVLDTCPVCQPTESCCGLPGSVFFRDLWSRPYFPEETKGWKPKTEGLLKNDNHLNHSLIFWVPAVHSRGHKEEWHLGDSVAGCSFIERWAQLLRRFAPMLADSWAMKKKTGCLGYIGDYTA